LPFLAPKKIDIFKKLKFLVPFAGIGPATSPLPRECSTTEPKGQNFCPFSH
jgi:hypothetical protein